MLFWLRLFAVTSEPDWRECTHLQGRIHLEIFTISEAAVRFDLLRHCSCATFRCFTASDVCQKFPKIYTRTGDKGEHKQTNVVSVPGPRFMEHRNLSKLDLYPPFLSLMSLEHVVRYFGTVYWWTTSEAWFRVWSVGRHWRTQLYRWVRPKTRVWSVFQPPDKRCLVSRSRRVCLSQWGTLVFHFQACCRVLCGRTFANNRQVAHCKCQTQTLELNVHLVPVFVLQSNSIVHHSRSSACCKT